MEGKRTQPQDEGVTLREAKEMTLSYKSSPFRMMKPENRSETLLPQGRGTNLRFSNWTFNQLPSSLIAEYWMGKETDTEKKPVSYCDSSDFPSGPACALLPKACLAVPYPQGPCPPLGN